MRHLSCEVTLHFISYRFYSRFQDACPIVEKRRNKLTNQICRLGDILVYLAFDWSVRIFIFYNGTSNLKSTVGHYSPLSTSSPSTSPFLSPPPLSPSHQVSQCPPTSQHSSLASGEGSTRKWLCLRCQSEGLSKVRNMWCQHV